MIMHCSTGRDDYRSSVSNTHACVHVQELRIKVCTQEVKAAKAAIERAQKQILEAQQVS